MTAKRTTTKTEENTATSPLSSDQRFRHRCEKFPQAFMGGNLAHWLDRRLVMPSIAVTAGDDQECRGH